VTIPRSHRSSRSVLLWSIAAAALLAGSIAGPVLGATPDRDLDGRDPANRSAVAPAGPAGITLIRDGFDQPLFVTHAGDSRLFVVEQTGRIRILRQVDGQWRITSTFLDLRGKVDLGHSEQGLLGLAFHPDYATNGRFYVNYIDLQGDSIVAEYRRATAGKADPASARQVLRVPQPYDNHNGGWLGFKGPYLYLAFGDGGSGGDPQGNGQDKNVLLGKILRIDPLDPDGSGPKRYTVPASNPFVGKPGRDEIWAFGVRNPWRNSFDRLTGDLWLGEVGQDQYEEIDHAGDGRGRNFGWNKVEGRHLYPSGVPCSTACKTLPVVEYPHSVAVGDDNCSVVGGYVSRRPGADLEGRYVFGDTCSGRIWAIPEGFAGADLPEPLDTSLFISSFGEGFDGTLYVVSLSGGVYRVVGS
jgi:glucose/arabinose dehydrogenase